MCRAVSIAIPVLDAQAPAQAPAPAADLAATFTKLEHDWMDALRREDYAALGSYLAREYALIVSAQPGRIISREDWLSNARA